MPLVAAHKVTGSPCKHGHGTLRYAIGRQCVECARLTSATRYTIRGDAYRARRRQLYATQGGRRDRKSRNLKQNYGLTIEDYEAMAAMQNFVCAICGEPEPKGLVVDHCHKTDQVRALLCVGCNLALGALGDSPDTCLKAADYLRKHAGA